MVKPEGIAEYHFSNQKWDAILHVQDLEVCIVSMFIDTERVIYCLHVMNCMKFMLWILELAIYISSRNSLDM